MQAGSTMQAGPTMQGASTMQVGSTLHAGSPLQAVLTAGWVSHAGRVNCAGWIHHEGYVNQTCCVNHAGQLSYADQVKMQVIHVSCCLFIELTPHLDRKMTCEERKSFDSTAATEKRGQDNRIGQPGQVRDKDWMARTSQQGLNSCVKTSFTGHLTHSSLRQDSLQRTARTRQLRQDIWDTAGKKRDRPNGRPRNLHIHTISLVLIGCLEGQMMEEGWELGWGESADHV